MILPYWTLKEGCVVGWEGNGGKMFPVEGHTPEIEFFIPHFTL